MRRSKNYRFIYSDRCNMCGAEPEFQVFLGRRLDRRQGLWPKWKPGITTSILQCRVCALIYADPMPIPETLEQHYDITPETYWATPDVESASPDYSETIRTFARLSQRTPHTCSALDIGAGLGKAMVAFARAGFDVFGIEPSPSFHRAAIERSGIREDRLSLASVERADFPPASFDFINLSAVLEHVMDPADVLERTARWLKPHGLMHVEVPSSKFLLSRLVGLFYRLTGANYVINTCPMHAPFHLYEFGLESFVRLGRRTGYSVALHEYVPCAGYMPAWLIGPFNTLMKATDTGMQLIVWLRKDSSGTSC